MNNKYKYLLLMLTLSFVFIIFTNLYAEKPEILKIRKQYGTIVKNKKKYQKKVINIEHKSENEDQLPVHETINIYYKKNNVHCIVSDSLGDMCGWVKEFYYKDNKIFFIFKYSWHTKRGTNMAENRYYFKNNKMIRWIDYHKNYVLSSSNLFKKEEKEMLKLAGEYLEKSKKKK